MTDRDDATRQVTELSAARDRIATAMYTVDTHPAWARLTGGLVAGETEKLRSALRPEVDLLWAYFAALGERLEQAQAILAPRRLGGSVPPELTSLLTQPVVGLDAAAMPVEETTTPVSRVSLRDLAERTERRSAAVLSQLSDVDMSTTAVTTQYVALASELAAVASLADQVGEADALTPVRASAAEIEKLDVGDPLTAAPGGTLTAASMARIERVRAALAATRVQLSAVAAVRDGYPQRRAALAALVDEIRAAEAAVAQAYTRAGEKIADPGLGPVPAAAAVLRSRLVDLDALRDRAQWRRLAADMSTVEDSARLARDRATRQQAMADGLLGRRDELRGRLDAYRAKAVARGLAEDGRLAALFVQAQQLLYTAPCDLRAATRAVNAYQTGLADPPGRRERSAVDD